MLKKNDYTPQRPVPKGRPQSKMSDKQEKRIAHRSGGKCQPASGALPFAKGDVLTPQLLIEAKSTAKESLSIKKKWLEKISLEAQKVQREPALTIHFESTDNYTEQDWICVPFNYLKFLLDFADFVNEDD